MVKKIYFLFILLLCSMMSIAQDFEILSVESLPTDMSARKEIKTDNSDRQCALLRIATQNIDPAQRDRFLFKPDLGSEVVERATRDGEIWLWVSPGLKYLRIMHRDLGQYELRLMDYVASIEALHTYRVVIKGDPTQHDFGWIEITGDGALNEADVYLDDVFIGKAPLRSDLVACGDHTIKVLKEDHDSYTETIKVTKNQPVVLSPKLRTNTKDEKVFTVNGVSFVMKKVEGGTFWMGIQITNPEGPNYYESMYPENDDFALGYSAPVHKVELDTYYIGETEVTQGLWEAVTGKSVIEYASSAQNKITMPDLFGYGKDYPMYYVSYNDIVNEFIPKLNKLTGHTFRLPTEAEWEYAAWGGRKTHHYLISGGDLDEAAWYSLNSGDGYDEVFNAINGKSHPVGLKKPNELGLYDMTGNVSEWCSDWSDEYPDGFQKNPQGPATGKSSLHIVRGGHWQFSGESFDLNVEWCVARRDSSSPDTRWRSIGFRLVCDE
ncbi:MAG: SUMF1/EgtB/PvdO family nonheme iron enzyme [Bacteroidales bacterium]|nr:SUMF1/EgtB/PvdO family nonheme iron enzyme [Bacteroidales bacterium]